MSESQDRQEAASEAFYARLTAMRAASGPERIVVSLWDDVTDRRDWRQAADQFDYAIRHEILDRWLAIVKGAP